MRLLFIIYYLFWSIKIDFCNCKICFELPNFNTKIAFRRSYDKEWSLKLIKEKKKKEIDILANFLVAESGKLIKEFFFPKSGNNF